MGRVKLTKEREPLMPRRTCTNKNLLEEAFKLGLERSGRFSLSPKKIRQESGDPFKKKEIMRKRRATRALLTHDIDLRGNSIGMRPKVIAPAMG